MESPELKWLVVTTVFTAVLWLPYIINRILEMGLLPAVRSPRPEGRPSADWAYRAERAHANAVENLVVFAPLAILVGTLGLGTAATASAAQIFFVARAAHWIIYVAGVPFLRTVAFAVAFVCQMVLAAALLGG